MLAALPVAVSAQSLDSPTEAASDWDRNVFLFGGRFHERWVWDTALPFGLPYEDNYFLGAGYQQFFYQTDWNLRIGAEFGAGARIGLTEPSSLEVWGGYVVRHDGIELFDTVRVGAAITGGVSVVTDPIGVEADRAAAIGLPVNLLFYMGPEINVTPLSAPEFEAFFRIQHRSGGLGAIMSLDGSNAATVGVRYKF